MARVRWWPGLAPLACAALLLLAPALAVAGDAASTRDLVLDFERSGVLKDLLGKTLGVARSFLFLSAFLAYALEAFGRAPSEGRDYGAVTWRLVLVLFLLWNYQAVFGGVIGLLDRLEREVAPDSTWKALITRATEMRQALEALASNGEAPPSPSAQPSAPSAGPLSRLASWTYEALVAVVQLLAEGAVFLINWLSRILTATLFILGPLALVAGIPRVSRTGTRWFLRFVTIASWPIFSGVLLSVLVTVSAQGALRRSYLECLVAALVMLVTALSTPTLASHVIGGALENFAAAGFLNAVAIHRHATRTAHQLVGGGGHGAGGEEGEHQGGRGRGAGRGGGSAPVNGPWGGGYGPSRGGRARRGGGAAGREDSGGGAWVPPARPAPAQGGVVANPPSPAPAPPLPGPGRPGPTVPAPEGGVPPGRGGRRS